MGTSCGRFIYILYSFQKRNYLYGWVFITEVAGCWTWVLTAKDPPGPDPLFSQVVQGFQDPGGEGVPRLLGSLEQGNPKNPLVLRVLGLRHPQSLWNSPENKVWVRWIKELISLTPKEVICLSHNKSFKGDKAFIPYISPYLSKVLLS